MIRMDVSHDSERCSRDFRQGHAAFLSNRHLFPSQYDIMLLFMCLYIYMSDKAKLIVLSIATDN